MKYSYECLVPECYTQQIRRFTTEVAAL